MGKSLPRLELYENEENKNDYIIFPIIGTKSRKISRKISRKTIRKKSKTTSKKSFFSKFL